MIVVLWFDKRYRDEGKLKIKNLKNYEEFGYWFVKDYRHIHIVDIEVKLSE